MATSGHVAVAQNGGQGNVKLHPYLISLVRWCVSCVWSTASVLLHRLMTTPLQPITGPKPCVRRAPGTEHLNPEPRVECQLLHHPAIHTMDVIFVHGLYGSLGNTWKQGDWSQKYVAIPKIVTLRDHSKQNRCKCHENSYKNHIYNDNKCIDNENNVYDNDIRYENITDLNDPETSYRELNEKLAKKVIPEENDLITEQFYNNTLVDQKNVEKYDTQAKFVHDMFKKENNCDRICEKKYNKENNRIQYDINIDNEFKCTYNDKYDDNDFKSNNISDYDYKCKYNENNECVCNENKRYTYNENNESKYSENNECICNENKGYKYNENNESKYSENNEYICNENKGYKYNENNESKYSENNEYICNENKGYKYNENNDYKYNENNECKCNKDKICEAGCGCTCNDCYSLCWPKDWIKADFPGARVISINYTSDPYLWRPLWIKENKRLNLYQRAEQMIEQLLEMGVGEKPIIWVGHSKGGLFIKQIYCEAHEAYMKINKKFTNIDDNKQVIIEKNEEEKGISREINNGITADNIDTIIGHFSHEEKDDQAINDDNFRENDNYNRVNDNYTRVNDNLKTTNDNHIRNDSYTRENDDHRINDKINNNKIDEYNNMLEQKYNNLLKQMRANNNKLNENEINDNIRNLRIENGEEDGGEIKQYDGIFGNEDLTSSIEASLSSRASLWLRSRGFMFYSVPHRGSPLADIKTPVTARSVDLLEIAKDCPLVVELQSRWERAMGPGDTGGARPAVRGVVETCRTLMSVLWLRIVSTESADAGFGTLSGISVDHREICKPTSRACPLYTMLKDLINEATTCTCQ